ncbi:hypothetical protein [Streptomyces sp. NPDC059909]|uniref:hypothetical protein n=1 Tax=Streptomyces sp. NPDC059909 TaxID=3346998 RepID=UPI0036618C94
MLRSLLTSTPGAPRPRAPGAIEGVPDALAGAARFRGGVPADDPARRRKVAVGGYATTAVLGAANAGATAVWQVGLLRAVVIPGLVATAAIIYAIRRTPRPTSRDKTPLKIRIEPVPTGNLGKLMGAVAAFEVGDIAVALLILRTSDLRRHRHGRDRSPLRRLPDGRVRVPHRLDGRRLGRASPCRTIRRTSPMTRN